MADKQQDKRAEQDKEKYTYIVNACRTISMNGVKPILKGELKVLQSQISDKMDRIQNAIEKNVEENLLEQENRNWYIIARFEQQAAKPESGGQSERSFDRTKKRIQINLKHWIILGKYYFERYS